MAVSRGWGMRTVSIGIFAATLLMVSLAGCASTEPTQSAAEPSGDAAGGAPPAGPADQPDDAPLEWGVVFTVDGHEGSAPFAVGFHLDVTQAFDTLLWTLDLGDGAMQDGTALPVYVDHTYSPGDFTATLTVIAQGESKAAAVAIAVAEAPEPELPAPSFDNYTAEVLLGLPWLLWDATGQAPATKLESVAWASYEHGLPNQDNHALTVPAGLLNLTIRSAALAGQVNDPDNIMCGPEEALEFDTDMFLFTTAGDLIASSSSCGTDELIQVELPAPGDYVLVQLGYTGANMEIATTITLQPDYV